MKRFPFFLLATAGSLLLLTGCGEQNITVQTEPDNPVPTISVNGDGFVEAKPDQVGFTVTLLGRGETAQAATGQVNEQATKMIDALKGAGVEESDIQTGFVNVQPEYEQREAVVVHSLADKPKPRLIVGYNASYAVTFTVTPLEKFDPVSKVVQSVGFSSLNGPNLSLADPAKYESQALEKAFADAKAKAEVLAAQSGLKISGVKSVSGNATGGGPRPLRTTFLAEGTSERAPMPLEAGVQRIGANVGVVFLAAPAQ